MVTPTETIYSFPFMWIKKNNSQEAKQTILDRKNINPAPHRGAPQP
jgi:hypothetical protein